MKPITPKKRTGFTLIELLVALAILGIIVAVCGKIFSQSNVAWKTGSLKAEGNLIGRGVADFIAQDLSRCVVVPNSFDPPTLEIINESLDSKDEPGWPMQTITYSFGDPPARKVNSGLFMDLAPKGYVKAVALTHTGPYVDVKVTVQISENAGDQKEFKSRAWLINANRYKYDN